MLTLLTALALLVPQTGAAQAAPTPPRPGGVNGLPLERPRKVDIAFNRLYDDAELYAHFDRIEAAYPELVSHEVIGHSVEGREMRVYTVHAKAAGDARDVPAMWVDANVHGNEIQGGEVTLYLAWYLCENYGALDEVTELLDGSAFYVLPMVNPDGRHHWIHDAHNPHSSRTGYRPVDDDRDGVADEDPPDDLDGDGQITMMRKYVPGEGTHRIDRDDPRVMERVGRENPEERGDWLLLGSEGIDNDGDGRVNEDGAGGYDMNRAWPSSWQPEHVQYGAGPYPLSWPETRCIAEFVLAHPNLAAVQSFHNAGGMILRGPGAEVFGEYPRADLRVYDELGKDGELMLPFYRYMVIWKDLYSVFGGFVNWTYEGLGIISFTNELWTDDREFPDDEDAPDRHWFDDHLRLGAGFVDWHPAHHPLYGDIEIGGFRKDVGRVPPSFMIEEMCHRNALFCVEHARAMPCVTVRSVEVAPLAGDLRAVDVVLENDRAIPTRTARAAQERVGEPDVVTLEGDGVEVLAGGPNPDRWHPERMQPAERDPARLVLEQGLGGRSELHLRWIVRGTGNVTVRWRGEKARDVSQLVPIE
ncbi:MAG: peptidase M14 [Planctomycetes bacterium]|nr:peptidase M14 [Planctomycetota bacterium]